MIARADPRKTSVWTTARRRLLGIDVGETTFARRGFHAPSPVKAAHFELIGATFVEGYHAALTEHRPDALAAALESVPRDLRGFAYEGAAMALYLLDKLTPWRRDRWQRFLAGPGQAHVYMMHVGAGWVLGRLPVSPERMQARMDPLLGWLAIDGYAFHEAYFGTERAVVRGVIPHRLKGYARSAWDMGLGRGLWFVDGADVERVAARMNEFDCRRRAHLWSGVGLACAYAGGTTEDELRHFAAAAGPHRSSLAQGVTFAAKARERAGNPAAHTEMASRTICEMTAADAARVTDEALVGATSEGDIPAFEVWRRRIQSRFV